MSDNECLVDVVSGDELLDHSSIGVTPDDAKLMQPHGAFN
jgi:hypothetical protein